MNADHPTRRSSGAATSLTCSLSTQPLPLILLALGLSFQAEAKQHETPIKVEETVIELLPPKENVSPIRYWCEEENPKSLEAVEKCIRARCELVMNIRKRAECLAWQR